MNVLLLDRNFAAIGIVDTYKSFIWTDRYNEPGDFEVYVPASIENVSFYQLENYIQMPDLSEHDMIIESVELETDIEEGDFLKVTGRSLESILERRVAWGITNLKGNLQTELQKLFDDNIINPSIPERKISNFIFELSTDPRITGLTVDTQYTGESLSQIVQDLTQDAHIGYKLIRNMQNQFVFSLYAGEDHSYAQNTNPFVVFSPNFDNLSSSNYLRSTKEIRTAVLIGGEKDTDRNVQKFASFAYADTGLDRREAYLDQSSLSSKDENDNQLSPAEYTAKLQSKGKEAIDKTKITTAFEGEVEATLSFIYGRDFGMGDIVQIENRYGINSISRITEYVITHDSDGIKMYPTFVNADHEDEEN